MAGFGVYPVLDSNVDSYSLSFLLVSQTEELLLLVRDALLKAYYLQKQDYKLNVHLCESVLDIVKARCKVQADFVVFVMDTRRGDCLDEVRQSVRHLGCVYKYGQMCLVNSFCEVSPLQLGVSYSDMLDLGHDLGVHLLNAAVTDKQRCLHLGHRLHNLCSTIVGLRTSIPFLDVPYRACHPHFSTSSRTVEGATSSKELSTSLYSD